MGTPIFVNHPICGLGFKVFKAVGAQKREPCTRYDTLSSGRGQVCRVGRFGASGFTV